MLKDTPLHNHSQPWCHGGGEQVVRYVGSPVVGSFLCSNNFCPSGSHRFIDSPCFPCPAIPLCSHRRPIFDALPPTIAGLASPHSRGDTPARRLPPLRGDSLRGDRPPLTAGSPPDPGGLTSISDTAPTTAHAQRATGSHRDTVPPTCDTVAPRAIGSPGVTDTDHSGLPAPRVSDAPTTLCQQYLRPSKAALLYTSLTTWSEDPYPHQGAPHAPCYPDRQSVRGVRHGSRPLAQFLHFTRGYLNHE